MSDSEHAIRLVTMGYQLDTDPSAWVHSLAEGARPLIDQGLGAWAFTYQMEDGRPVSRDTACVGAAAGNTEFFRAASDAVPGDALWQGAVRTLSGIFGRDGALEMSTRGGVKDRMGCVDSIALGVTDPEGFGVAVGAPLSRFAEVSRQRDRLLARTAAHLHTALRARRRLREADEAVLATDGRVVHAEAEARAPEAREALRDAARAIDRARSRLGASNAEDALEAWRAMVVGRWTLVDRFESDGRRFLVARPNAPRPRSRTGLSSVETACALYASMGHSGKLIAYELGIAESTVSTHLRSAMRKLGLRSRAELAGALGASRVVERK